jgi:hypothetical protein
VSGDEVLVDQRAAEVGGVDGAGGGGDGGHDRRR